MMIVYQDSATDSYLYNMIIMHHAMYKSVLDCECDVVMYLLLSALKSNKV